MHDYDVIFFIHAGATWVCRPEADSGQLLAMERSFFHQIEELNSNYFGMAGIDYEDTFSPVVKIAIVHICTLSCCVKRLVSQKIGCSKCVCSWCSR